MICICAPYTRSEATLAALAVANAASCAGSDVLFLPEGKPTAQLDPYWDHAVRLPVSRLKKQCRLSHAWVFFTPGTRWRRQCGVYPDRRYLTVGVPNWRLGASWWHRMARNMVVPPGVIDNKLAPRSYRKRALACRWGSGFGILRQPGVTNRDILVVLGSRALQELNMETLWVAVAEWRMEGRAPVFCFWNGVASSDLRAWWQLSEFGRGFLLDRPTLPQLLEVARRCQVAFLPDSRYSVYGAWPPLLGTMGCWPVGYETPATHLSLGTAVPITNAFGKTVSLWRAFTGIADHGRESYFQAVEDTESAFLNFWSMLDTQKR